ncbi:MAG: asparagine synthase (glutamine-hydrolyzing) [Cytophagales bacterium]|nr:asparagine synthase (glutamine-hydrolyzing) [Cytophagales bacterium]
MCGICGIASPLNFNERDAIVHKMNNAITHRGPDENGFYSSGFCTLAMSRLSIIDLKGGKQPIFNENDQYCVIFNGEIYNYKELKEDLSSKGHKFKTNTDTEVIVHLYEEYGADTPRYLKGMFAFCVCDIKNEALFFARDRFGEKPLYYYYKKGVGIAFSSEIASLLSYPAVPRILDFEALGYYLKVSIVPEPLTLFKDIKSLPPGCWLEYKDDNIKVKSYHQIDYAPDKNLKTISDVIDLINPVLEKAVKRQTISDVPIGAFLSGGIDSSTVVAKLQQNSSKNIKTFTVKFEESTYDESKIAKQVAQHLGTEHHEITIPNMNFTPGMFWTILEHTGLPFPDSSAIPTYIITKEISKYVKVALSGDGGDEVFAGYNIFQWGNKIQSLKKMPPGLRKFNSWVLNKLTSSPFFAISKLRQIRKATNISLFDDNYLPVELHSMFNTHQLNKMIVDKTTLEYVNGQMPLLTYLPEEAEDWTQLKRLMYYRLKHNLPLDMLTKVDRMSMANSLEVRTPFLDVDLFDESMKIPDKFLIKNGKGKYIIRQLMKNSLPRIVFEHPKSGFSIPLHKYQNKAYEELANSLINENNPISELFSKQYINIVKELAFTRKSDKGDFSVYQITHQLWAIMHLFGWVKRFGVSV